MSAIPSNVSAPLNGELFDHYNDNCLSEADGLPRQPPEAPRPLTRAVGEPDAFPVDALGPFLAPAARAIADLVNAPLATTGTSVLAAATLVVQGHVDVVLPHGQRRPTSNLYVSIGESGLRKSAFDGYANMAIQHHQDTLADRYDDDLDEYAKVCKAAREAGEPIPLMPRGPIFRKRHLVTTLPRG